VTGGELATPTALSVAPPTIWATAPEPAAAVPTPTVTLPAPPAEASPATDDASQNKNQKGNRLVRALGKINPFRKNSKQ
jgi:hypothetical protein